MNTFMNNLKNATNVTLTDNGAVAAKTTNSKVYDMFAFAGACRRKSDEDCILLFKEALDENAALAMRCLFWVRDVRGGAGERRFFRVCFKWLCGSKYNYLAKKNLVNLSEYGRWDDLIYTAFNTPLEKDAMNILANQLRLDITCKTPSLLAKWLPSENASSETTKKMAIKFRNYLGISSKKYRQTLSKLRGTINVVEKLMSANRWDEIEFDKIPSKAGLIYKNAFARRDLIAKKYEAFAKDENTKVNAKDLFPYDVVNKAIHCNRTEVDRKMIDKYWENLPDYLEGKPCKMMCVIDTSGSMTGWNADAPINVAISLGMYCAERQGGPFKNHYISFSSVPQLIEIRGVDTVDKVERIYNTNLCENTNLKATFDLVKEIALSPTTRHEDVPDTLVVISDMQIDSMSGGRSWRNNVISAKWTEKTAALEMDKIRIEWAKAGLKVPKLVYWNVNASNPVILDSGPNVSFVSGCSPTLFKQILTGKTGYELMLETIMAKRYDKVNY